MENKKKSLSMLVVKKLFKNFDFDKLENSNNYFYLI